MAAMVAQRLALFGEAEHQIPSSKPRRAVVKAHVRGSRRVSLQISAKVGQPVVRLRLSNGVGSEEWQKGPQKHPAIVEFCGRSVQHASRHRRGRRTRSGSPPNAEPGHAHAQQAKPEPIIGEPPKGFTVRRFATLTVPHRVPAHSPVRSVTGRFLWPFPLLFIPRRTRRTRTPSTSACGRCTCCRVASPCPDVADGPSSPGSTPCSW